MLATGSIYSDEYVMLIWELHRNTKLGIYTSNQKDLWQAKQILKV